MGHLLERLPVSSQLRFLAFSWYGYALLGLVATWVCGTLARVSRGKPGPGRIWAPAGAAAAGAWLEVASGGDGAASLPRVVLALLAAALAFLGLSWTARRLRVLREPGIWAAANLAGFFLAGVLTRSRPAFAHGIGSEGVLLLAPALLAPTMVLLLGASGRLGWRPAVAGAASTLALLTVAVPGDRTAAAAGREINVLLITVDTLRADHMGSYGGTVPTPTFDALAGEGVLVETAISPIPLTAPSHATLLTGLQPANHGLLLNLPMPLRPGVRTLPEVLSDRGYRTAAFVAGFTLKSRVSPLFERFQLYDDDFSRVPLVPEPILGTSLVRLPLREMGKPLAWRERNGERTVRAASDWLRRNGTAGPFFLWVHLWDPHGPYLPPPDFVRRFAPGGPGPYRGDWYAVPVGKRREFLADPREVRTLRALYGAEVAYADREAGRLLALVRDLGLLERTLVVLTSDHGESLTEHGYYFNHAASLHEPTLRVPLILRFPEGRWAGRRISRIAGLADVAPTIREVLELRAPRRMDGVSFLRDLQGAGNPAAPVLAAVFPGEIPGGKSLFAVRTAEHKYIWSSPWWAGHILMPEGEELYDLRRDPDELLNLAAREPELLARYRAHAEPYRRRWLAPASPGRALPGEEELRELRSLGYMQ
ncbi:MAG TPA: sulfatase-like hydrolase/transferase [Thermoanaerobaculia bacterium]|nr:sulfatase-like hydrolase/transferase [Thermoanaerobaculia bacterium]